MTLSGLTRRSALLGGLGAAWPAFARGGAGVDVSPLRAQGDNTDADHFARVLPGYLARSIGPGHSVHVRIDSVVYGPPGSNGQAGNNGAVDWIEGVGFVDGRAVPLTCSLVVSVSLPDVAGYYAHLRQDNLARAFAQWLPRQAGL
jgi:hypothetical protein